MKQKCFFKNTNYYSPEIIIFLSFIAIQVIHINYDFWNDEIYTLKHFTFSPIIKTLTDYHVPNNHIAFNLINNIYLKIIGIHSLHTLMDCPYILRIIPLIYSLITILYTYKITRLISNRKTAIIASITTITLIPYFNFSLQIRGYELSTLSIILLSYHCIHYIKNHKKRHIIATSFFSFLAFITIPSNIYYLFSISVAIISRYILHEYNSTFQNKKISIKSTIHSVDFQLLSCITTGAIIGLFVYLPIFESVFMNEYVIPGKSFDLIKLWFYVKNLSKGFISGKWILILISFIAIIKNWNFILKRKQILIPIIIVLITPVLITFIRGDNAPLRVFVVSMPFFAILISILIYSFIQKYILKETYKIYSIYLIIAYSIITFFVELGKINNQTLENISKGGRSQNLYEQYYSSHYTPLKDSKTLSQFHTAHPNIPVVRIGCEPHGISNYLEKFNIPMYSKNKYDSLINTHDSLIIVTNNLNLYSDSININAKKITTTACYHNILLVSRYNTSVAKN